MTDPASEAVAAFRANELSRAESIAQGVLARDRSNRTARLILGGAYIRTGRFDIAIPALEEVLQQDPGSRDALIWILEALRKTGRLDEAAHYGDRACNLFPSDPEILYLAGMCQLESGRYQEAETRLGDALKLSRRPRLLHYLGVCLLKLDRPEAAALLEEARIAEPEVPSHYVMLGLAKLRLRLFEEAEHCASQALQLRADDPGAHLLVARVLNEQGRFSEAEAPLRLALASDPESAEANRFLQTWLLQMGRFEELEAHFDRAIQKDPTDTVSIFYKLQHRKAESRDLPLLETMTRRLEAPGVPDHEKLYLLYGLAKASIDLGDLAAGFMNYDAANEVSYRIHSARAPYDAEARRSFADWAIETFTEESFGRWAGFGNASERPLLVVGLIRSGTTLMEQLLSAHPDVAGAGELDFWLHRGTSLAEHDLDPGSLRPMAADYLRLLQQRAPSARFVVDKMPPNEVMLGFIHASFPNTRIIQMLRDPLDVALSMWMTFIQMPPDYANNKQHIVEAYAQFDRLRQHWAQVLPRDRYLTVQYEELTQDPETVMRRVLEFCDLPWDEACIHPERNQRLVQTPSLYRVRGAIDTASVSKKDRFGPYLGEFAALA